MPKIKVLFCLLYLAHGGTEKQLMALLSGLDGSSYEPHLCCIKQTSIEHSFRSDARALFDAVDCEKLQIDFTSFRNPRTVLQILQLARFIRKHEIDIIVSYFIDPPVFSYLAACLSFRKPRFVVNFRDLGLLRPFHNRLLRYVFCNSDAFLANSLAIRDNYVEYDKLPEKKFTVIPNGLDIKKFTSSRKPSRVPKVIILVANLNRRVKRVDVFIRAAKIVVKQRPDARFIVVGEGDLKGELEVLVDELGIGAQISFVGRTYDVAQCLQDADIGVNTSETEGFANGILEYLAAGLPVIATASGGNNEIVVEGENGYLFPVNDFEALAKYILLLLNDFSLYERLSANARATVTGRFEMNLMIQRYQEFFDQLSNGM